MTIVGEWRFNNLCRSHPQSLVSIQTQILASTKVVEMSTTVIVRTPITQMIIFNQGSFNNLQMGHI